MFILATSFKNKLVPATLGVSMRTAWYSYKCVNCHYIYSQSGTYVPVLILVYILECMLICIFILVTSKKKTGACYSGRKYNDRLVFILVYKLSLYFRSELHQ